MKRLLAGFLGLHAVIFCVVFRRPKKCWDRDHYACAVVCGYPAREDGSPSRYMKTRVEKAVKLWKDKKVSYLLMSGGAVQNAFVESEVMKAYAVSLGVPKERIVTEKHSVSTYHNLKYAKDILAECGWKDCVVVTDGWHLRKADHYARKFKLSYVMEKAERPEDQNLVSAAWKCVCTNVQMYLNLYRGYW